MLKRLMVLLLLLSIAGCGDKIQTYIDEPGTLIRDPHFEQYQTKRDGLESEYLNKEIDYSEYLTQKKTLDDQYTKEVQERNSKVMSP